MFDPHAHAGKLAIRSFVVCGQHRSTRLFLGLLHQHTCDRKALKAQVLIQMTPRRQAIGLFISETFIMPFPFIGRTEETNMTIVVNEHEIFDGVTLFLAAVVERLFIRVAWPIYASFRAIVEKRERSFGLTASGTVSTAVRWGR